MSFSKNTPTCANDIGQGISGAKENSIEAWVQSIYKQQKSTYEINLTFIKQHSARSKRAIKKPRTLVRGNSHPDEEVWKYLKNVKLIAHQARNKREFAPLVRSKMKGMQRKPHLIKSFFVGTYVL